MDYRTLILISALVLALPGAPDAAQSKFKLKPGGQGKICLKCHVSFQEKLAAAFVHTPVKQGECSGCHNPHTSSHQKLLSEDSNDLCVRCHGSLIPEKAGSVHAVVAERRCLDCHDPHVSGNKANVKEAGNKLCFTCHGELGQRSAKNRFKHRPVEQACLTCHTPHASATAAKLLKDGVPSLCVGCHKTDRPLFAKQHMQYPVAKAKCTSCHDPHGSDRAAILYDGVHKPVASRMCNQCHEDPTSPNPLATRKTGFELCRTCHAGQVKDAFAQNYLHWPVAGPAGCESCHTPHGSPKNGLLKGSQAAVCGSCHSDTMARLQQVKSQHQPVKDGNCSACHQPHGANNPMLLGKASVPDLCGTCHDWQKHQTHPIESVMDPRARNISVSCASCHNTHGTDHKRMLPNATITELCVQCHEQYRR
jgi:predicted CXXCH cytochrome family protein